MRIGNVDRRLKLCENLTESSDQWRLVNFKFDGAAQHRHNFFFNFHAIFNKFLNSKRKTKDRFLTIMIIIIIK